MAQTSSDVCHELCPVHGGAAKQQDSLYCHKVPAHGEDTLGISGLKCSELAAGEALFPQDSTAEALSCSILRTARLRPWPTSQTLPVLGQVEMRQLQNALTGSTWLKFG